MADVEALTQDYGREVFARLDRTGPLFLSKAWLDDRLMEWSMGDPAIKLQLFRFIDALPLLHSPPEITRHLREYFGEAGTHLPGWLRAALRWLPENGLMGRMLAGTARANARRLARRFIAASTLDEALAAIAVMRSRSLAFTIDLLGEATITEAEAQAYQQEYLHMIDGLAQAASAWPIIPLIDGDERGPIPRVNLSIKLSSLYSQFDPIDPDGTSRAVKRRLLPILHTARRCGAFVNVDMEQHAFKDLTLRIFREALEEDGLRDWPDAGIAIQGYLRSCTRDLDDLARWVEKRGTPVWVRLIKGAYWDFETVVAAQQGWPVPVFTHKCETDANFERLSLFLLQNRALLRPAFGSHNVRSVAFAMAQADALGVPDRAYEIQMLYGMAEPVKNALVSMGRRVRVYTPYGQLLPGMAYLVRRLLENTANESFLRASFTEHVPEERLLMNPAARGDQNVENRELSADGDNANGDTVLRSRSSAPYFHNEPVTDFSREEGRQAMEKALWRVAGELGRTYPLVISNRPVSTAAILERINPSHTRRLIGRCGRATAGQATTAIEAARAAYPGWRDTSPADRAALLFRAADIMRRRRFELAAWECLECGKQWREADADVAEAIDFCNYYAHEMLRLAPPQRHDVPGEENQYFYEPRGVAVVIAPWNFPLAILCGMTAAALVTGNTVIMKPAEQSSVVGAKLMEVLMEAGAPAGVVNYVPGLGEEIGPVLTAHPDVALIVFTGSLGVALGINESCARTPPGQDHVKRVIAEMGGKNAIVIDQDADLDEAVQGVVHSAFGYQGQKCSACSRAVVLEGIYDAFLVRAVEASRSLRIAPAEDPGSFVGPVIDVEAYQRIGRYIDQGKKEARLAFAGEVGDLAGEGYYIGPHIFADVPPSAAIAQEEIFGPVLSVIKARDLSHALEIANGTRYALTGGLYSRSPASIARVKRELRVGNLYINRKITGALVGRQPFGGYKLSGIGSKAGGPDYLLQMVVPRTITENTMRRGFAPAADAADSDNPSGKERPC